MIIFFFNIAINIKVIYLTIIITVGKFYFYAKYCIYNIIYIINIYIVINSQIRVNTTLL